MIYCRLTASESFSEPDSLDECCIGTRKLCLGRICVRNSQLKRPRRENKGKVSVLFLEKKKVFERKRCEQKNNFDISSSTLKCCEKNSSAWSEQVGRLIRSQTESRLDFDESETEMKWKLGKLREAFCRAADGGRRQNQSMHSFRLMSCPVMGVNKSSKREKWKTTISKFNFPFSRRCEWKSFYLFDILKGRTWPGESRSQRRK